MIIGMKQKFSQSLDIWDVQSLNSLRSIEMTFAKCLGIVYKDNFLVSVAAQGPIKMNWHQCGCQFHKKHIITN